jgi:hypothetical protein
MRRFAARYIGKTLHVQNEAKVNLENFPSSGACDARCCCDPAHRMRRFAAQCGASPRSAALCRAGISTMQNEPSMLDEDHGLDRFCTLCKTNPSVTMPQSRHGGPLRRMAEAL